MSRTFAFRLRPGEDLRRALEDGAHLHISVSDGDGRTLGGHLAEGTFVHTTAQPIPSP